MITKRRVRDAQSPALQSNRLPGKRWDTFRQLVPRFQRSPGLLLFTMIGFVTILFLYFISVFLTLPQDLLDTGNPAAMVSGQSPPFLFIPSRRQSGGLPAASLAFNAGGSVAGRLDSLKDFCKSTNTSLSRLQRASWITNQSLFSLPVSPSLHDASYAVVGGPTCLHAGAVYAAVESFDDRAALFREHEVPLYPLTDAVLDTYHSFSKSQKKDFGPRSTRGWSLEDLSSPSTYGTSGFWVEPAMALLTNGPWIASHFLHMVNDVLESLSGFYDTYNGGEMKEIPTQTVLLFKRSSLWEDRRGDLQGKMSMSSAILNAFSSPYLGGSPYNTSFLFQTNVYRTQISSKGPVMTADTALSPFVCFCDAALVAVQKPKSFSTATFYNIQDLVSAQFRSMPYTTGFDVWRIENQRRREQPFAQRFWSRREVGPYAPRALFIHRTSRLIANASLYAEWMREQGFRVMEVYLERFSAEEQYYFGRYADVIVGMHGLGVGHAMWMERLPYACRTVIEFRPWVIQSMPVQLSLVLGNSMHFNYKKVIPIDVQFGPEVADPDRERYELLSTARMVNAFQYLSFTHQTALYNSTEVRQLIAEVYQHLMSCLPGAKVEERM